MKDERARGNEPDGAGEEALRHEVQLLGEILDASTEFVATATPDLRLTYLNEAGRVMLGWPPDVDLSQKTVHELHPTWALQIISGEGVPEAGRRGTWSGETALLGMDGTEIPVEQRIIAHYDGNGTLAFFSTIMRDISVQKAAQQELEAKTRAIESSVTATAIAAPDGTLTYVNQAFLDLWGEESKDDVLGRNAVSFWSDPEAAAAVMAAIAREDLWRGELQGRRNNGARFTVWLSASVTRNSSGDVESLFATFTDISERVAAERLLRDSQERFSAALEHNRSFVWEIDDTGLYTYASGGCELVTGYSAEELVGNLHYHDLYPTDDREEFKKQTLEIIRRGEPFERYESAFHCKDGEKRWVSASGQPMFDDHGGVRGYRGVSNDITEERNARERLERSETLLSETERIATTGSWEQDLLTGSVVWSRELFRILDMDPDDEDPSPTAFIERVHPDDRPDLEERFAHAVAARTTFEVRGRLLLSDGTIKHVKTAGAFDYDETGSPVRAVGFVRDVTGLVELQRDLRLRTDAMESSITGMSIVTPDGMHVYANEALVKMSGAKTRDELLGTNAATFHDDPRELDEIFQQLQAYGTYSGEFLAKRLDGSTLPVLFGATVLRAPNGEIEYVMATFVDVTERKRAEAEARTQAERFARLLDTTPQGYWLVDPDTRIIDLNQSACDILGYTCGEMLSLRVNDIEVQETTEETMQRIQRLLEHGFDRFETRHRRKDGSVIDVMVSVTLLADDDEPSLLAFIDDISEQKRIDSLRREREIAVRANEVKDAFLRNITHELRTPLNAVMGFAQLMQSDDTLSEMHASSIREIAAAGGRLLGLINQILEFTRIDSGVMELSLQPVDCDELVREALETVGAAAADQGIQLRHEPPARQQLRARADRALLRKALLNLLTNAIVYNKPEGSVELTLRSVDARVRFTVTDTGVGIPLEQQAEVFTSFNRLGRETLSIEGTGIGLMYSKRLVELMGGTIEFESTEGAGSSFWIELPREGPGSE